MGRPFYAIQPAFTGGEISEDVASRVDLDKYQLALLQAENMIIRPYGSAKKRAGSMYCGTTKDNGHAILRRFEFTSDLSYMLEIGAHYIRVWRDGKYLGVELATPFEESELTKIRTVQSVDVMYICTGTHPVYKLSRYAEDNWTLKEVDWTLPPFGEINEDEDLKLSFSATEGTVNITANKNIFQSTDIGDFLKIEQRVGGKAASVKTSGTATSEAIRCGETWKIITHGSWTGKVKIEQSEDGGNTWKELRSYTSSNDYNPTESGTVEESCLLRISTAITSGSVTADLSAYPYKATGYIKITGFTNGRAVFGETVKPIGATTETADFYRGAWSEANGYPYTVTFFQDRLVFGGCKKYPQRVWMSKSGDYENFEVEKEGGSVTDDSAVTADLLSLKSHQIRHLVASNDLLVLTEGNTWTISGGETVTPSNISPRNQENYGCNDVEPMKVGTRIVYVQRRGNTIRDVGYTYDSDSYVGVDLTLLAKHLVRDIQVTDSAYVQEPDSAIYYVRSDGVMLCLTYVPDQKVYAWSHFKTAGTYEAVCSVSEANQDRVFAIVKRTTTDADGVTHEARYIEAFDGDHHTAHQQDYHMLDSYVTREYEKATEEIDGLDHLEGRTVYVLADNYFYDGYPLKVTGGKITLPEAVHKVTIGLPYGIIIEQPNFDAGNTDTGTLQGRKKYVSSAILRLVNSYGGTIGPDATAQNEIIYKADEMELGADVLYNGDKEIVLGKGGYDTYGRTYIMQDTPYPFTVSAIIREVTLR